MSLAAADVRLPDAADIDDAAARIAGHAKTTPLLESPLLNVRAGRRILVKAEPLQVTGSFKFRGAFNRISLIPPDDRKRGVVAYSSGNHAQGVAAAANFLGIPATIVMPSDAPSVKRRSTEAWGARIVPYDRHGESREEVAEALIAQGGATLVKPYDDPGIMAGQGTVGLELAAQLGQAVPEGGCAAVLVPCGGGGLVSGTALALSRDLPGVPVFAVEPAGYDDTARSLTAGERLANDPGESPSVCDALLAPTPGRLTFAVNRRLLAGGVSVDDEAALRAVGAAFSFLKLVVEPGGAVALAAALEATLAEEVPGKDPVAVVCSGGNVDPQMFSRAIAMPEAELR